MGLEWPWLPAPSVRQASGCSTSQSFTVVSKEAEPISKGRLGLSVPGPGGCL